MCDGEPKNNGNKQGGFGILNNEYVYKDGKALIIDENDNQKTVDYYDNLDEVLIQEDLIEKMEEEIKKLEKENSNYKKGSKFSRKFWVWYPFLLFTFAPLIMFPLLSKFFVVKGMIDTSLFGTISRGTLLGLIGTPLFAIPGSLLTLATYLNEKKLEKEQKGKEMQLEYLKINLVKQKETLEELKADKTNSKEKEDFYISKVDNIETLKKLRNFLSFYYNLGYNEEKYFRYYQKGKLDSYLGKFVNDVGIQFANQHFEEKEPTLVKRRKTINSTDKK